MLTLPDAIVPILIPFVTLFTYPTWRKAQVLLFGAILTPGQRTVAAALRVMGRSDHLDYGYHGNAGVLPNPSVGGRYHRRTTRRPFEEV